MKQPFDAIPDPSAQKHPRRMWGVIAITVIVFAIFGTCLVVPRLLYEAWFVETVELERMGWRFEARYEGLLGVSTTYFKLTYRGKEFEPSLPADVYLVTPVGDFFAVDSEWVNASRPGSIWEDGVDLLAETDDVKPWVKQIEHERDVAEFLAQGFYQAPTGIHKFSDPWQYQQLKGTPVHWVYVYRTTEPKPGETSFSDSIVTGYWVDPERIGELVWE